MDKHEIIRLFNYTVCEELMNDDMYYVNTREVSFDYDGEIVKLEDVTYLSFYENFIYFNDNHKFDMDKMCGGFLISTEPSRTLHPAITAFVNVKNMIINVRGSF